MDGEEIDHITRDIAPLTDIYPKRLTDEQWDDAANQRFALTYMEASSATQRFLWSPLINRIWPETLNGSIESYFIIRETRYRGGNKWAELDFYLRQTRLRAPVLEVFTSNEFRVGIALRVASRSKIPPPEMLTDLLAGALAARDLNRAIWLLESDRDRGFTRSEE